MKFEERNTGFRLEDIKFKLSGKKAVISQEIIANKKVNLILTYYNKASYNKDFNDWKIIQEQKFGQEKTQTIEGFKKLNFTIKNISYAQFVDISNRFIARIVFQAFSENLDLLNNVEELTVQIKIIHKDRWVKDELTNVYEHNDAFPETNVDDPKNEALKKDILDPGHVYITFSGIYILQGIVGPFVHINRIDYNFMYKYLSHELEHYIKFAKQQAIQDRFSKNIHPYLSKKGNYLLDYLYLTLFWLNVEGLAEFRKTRNAPNTVIIPKIIKNFRELITEMMLIKNKRQLEDFFQERIYAGSNDGVYYCGMYMCYFIAYSFEKDIKIVSKNSRVNNNLAIALAAGESFLVSRISDDAFHKTMEIVNSSTDPMHFVQVYEDACKKLKIPEENMVLSVKMFRNFWETAEAVFNKYIIRKLRELEYYPKV